MTNFVKPDPLVLTGNLSENWKTFKEEFDIYLKAFDLEKVTEDRKITILLNVIGKEARQLYNTFILDPRNKGNLSTAIEAFQNYCNTKKNILYSRFLFYSRQQEEYEPFDEFYNNLKTLIIDCDFKDPEDLLRDRVILGCHDKEIKEKLMCKDTITLEDAINGIRAKEFEKKHSNFKFIQQPNYQIKCSKSGHCNTDDAAIGNIESAFPSSYSDTNQELYNKVRHILNELTPQTFETLLVQVKALTIDTKEQVQGVIDLIFEKAVDQPNFSVAYVLMCKELALMQLPVGGKKEDPVNFRKLLVKRCQMEFEKSTNNEIARNIKVKEIEECTDPEKKKELHLLLEENDRRLRRKSVGNNTDGKKIYDRDFLLALRNDPKSRKKPDNLLDIIAQEDRGRVGDINRYPMGGKPTDFIPNFSGSNYSVKSMPTRGEIPKYEFEKKSNDETARNIKVKEIEKCADPGKKKELQLLLEENDRRLRRKSVGNIRFIGELFKQQMLTVNIMVRCLNLLLQNKDDESLEWLCELLSTVGKEVEEKKVDLNPIFKAIREIIDKKHGRISSRVRFMLQDVIDLRNCKWVPRRQDINPKTIDQIQKEANDEQLTIQAMNAVPLAPRKEERTTPGPGAGKRATRNTSDPEGWSTASSRGRAQFSVQSDKLKNKPPLIDEPLGSSQMFGTWMRGKNIKQQAQPTSANMYVALENIGNDIDKRGPMKDSYHSKGPDGGFHVNAQQSYVPPPPNQTGNQGPAMRTMAPTGPPNQASTPPNSDLKVSQMSQSLNLAYVQPVRGTSQNYYGRPPPQNQPPRMPNHRIQGQQPVAQVQKIYCMSYYGDSSQRLVIPQYYPGQTFAAISYPQTPQQTQNYLNYQQYIPRDHQPQVVASPPQNIPQVAPPPMTLPQTQPPQQGQKKQRRAKAIPIIDPESDSTEDEA